MEIKNLEVGAARYLVVVSQLKVCIILSDRSGTSQSSGLLNRLSINDLTSAASAARQPDKNGVSDASGRTDRSSAFSQQSPKRQHR